MRVAVEVQVAAPGIREDPMSVMADPDALGLRHARVLHEHALDVDDGARPGQVFRDVVVIAPDEVDAPVEACLDGCGVFGGALVGEVAEVPDDVIPADGLDSSLGYRPPAPVTFPDLAFRLSMVAAMQ
jgi:hypothetical protein